MFGCQENDKGKFGKLLLQCQSNFVLAGPRFCFMLLLLFFSDIYIYIQIYYIIFIMGNSKELFC